MSRVRCPMKSNNLTRAAGVGLERLQAIGFVQDATMCPALATESAMKMAASTIARISNDPSYYHSIWSGLSDRIELPKTRFLSSIGTICETMRFPDLSASTKKCTEQNMSHIHKIVSKRQSGIVRCTHCDDKLRFGTVRCSSCDRKTPIANRRSFWYASGAILACLGASFVLSPLFNG